MSYPEMCGLCFSRPSAHITEEGLYICGTCHQAIEDIKTENPSVVDRKRQDPSPLCCRCGICCVVLSARVEEDEAKEFHRQAVESGLEPKEFGDVFTVEEIGPHQGDTVFRFPCKYLRGKPLDYVSCAGYSLDRPSVCRSYLCKIAIKYSLGLITIKEAQFTLRSSFLSGALDLFNWTHPKLDDPDGIQQEIDEQKLIFYNHLNEQAQRMIDSGTPRDLVGMVVSAQITPVLDFKNAACHVLFNMHMAALDRDYIEPRVYVEADEVDSWPPEKKVFATQIVKHVLTELRDLFATKEELRQLQGERDGKEPEASGRDGGQGSGEEEEQAEARDSSDDVDLSGRGGVSDRRCDDGEPGSAEGEGDSADAPSEQDQHPASGSGSGARGAGGESGEERADPIRVACCAEPKLRGGRCDNCGQWSEEAELKPVDEFGNWDGSVIPEEERYGMPPCSMEDLEGPNPYEGMFNEDRDRTEQRADDRGPQSEPLSGDRSSQHRDSDSEAQGEGGDLAAEGERKERPVNELNGSTARGARNRKIVDDIIGMLTESCTCPDECPVHDHHDPRDREPFDLESDGVDDLDMDFDDEERREAALERLRKLPPFPDSLLAASSLDPEEEDDE